MYLNFALAMLLRAPLALDKRVLPFKLPTDELLGAGAAPAAFDPSIFDQSDLFPNGKVDAEGFADASEMF